MNDKMREQFLAWLSPGWDRESFIDDEGDEVFVDHWVQGAWIGWQASREILVVELPPAPAEPEEPEFAIDDSHMDAYHAARSMRDGCVKAIEAQGLKVKP